MANLPPHIALVAGETSGDNLGAPLIEQLRLRHPDTAFWGVGGEQMQAAGLDSAFPMNDIAVMGIIEPLKVLPRLIRRKNQLVQTILQNRPRAFIGIDAPDFNLRIARDVKANDPDIPIIHYVSPSVWAWRQHRVFGIKATIDLMITLFPFESAFYDQHQVPNACIGHPMAERLPIFFNKTAQRTALGIATNETVIALLPGSRESEIQRHLTVYCQAAERLQQTLGSQQKLRFMLPVARANLRAAIDAIITRYSTINIQPTDGYSSHVLQAADAALVTSGTATMEAMLCRCPMVVGYRTSATTYAIAKRLVKTNHIAIPNLLADQALVPEFIQTDCTADRLAAALAKLLQSDNAALQETFTQQHRDLQLGGSAAAAAAITQRIDGT